MNPCEIRLWYSHAKLAFEAVVSYRSRWSNGAEEFEVLQLSSLHKTYEFVSTPDGAAPQPSFVITKNSVQAMFDSLWEGGMRPTDSGSVNGEQDVLKDALNRERQLLDQVLGAALRKPA